jgi:hypothetical protein
MPYYPKSQIKTGLYTNGGEYVLITTKEYYKGSYYKTSSGKKYAGELITNAPSIELIYATDIINPEFSKPGGPTSNSQFKNFISVSPNLPSLNTQTNTPIIQPNNILPYTDNDKLSHDRYIPYFSPTLPTEQEKQSGYFNRYFCKKNNELRYIEINQSSYTKLLNKDKDIAWDLYSPATIKWQIKGDGYQCASSNQASVTLIERTLGWLGFSQYFKSNFGKYYVGA